VDDTQAMMLLRKQRHSFMNHLQVISGWLQLERPERAREYLEAVALRLTADADATSNFPPGLGLVAAGLALEAETYGVLLDWCSVGSAAALGHFALEALRTRVLEALQAASLQPESARRVEVRFSPDGYSVHTSFDKGES
jgi:hypothetical protein